MDTLRLVTTAIGTIALLCAFVAAGLSFVTFILMSGERRPIPLPQWLLLGGIWFLVDDNLTPEGLRLRRRCRPAVLAAIGLSAVFVLCRVLTSPDASAGSIREFFRPHAAAALP
jgi:hypothetical protein